MRAKKASEAHPDKIKCAICGKYYRRPVRHAQQAHGVFKREYKQGAGLDVKRGILTPHAREIMAGHVMDNGTINNLKAGEASRFQKGGANVPRYERSPQTLERLREHGKNLPHHNKRRE